MNESDLLRREVALLQRADLLECQADANAFLERHVSIEEPDGKVIPFRLWGFQRKTATTLIESTLAIVLKARRLGLSWLALALALWLAIFHQGIRILILCKTEGDAAELLDRIRRMRDRIEANPTSKHLLAGLKNPAKVRNAVTTLDIGSSTIRALVGTPAAARSETAGLVIWDEAAFQQHAEEIWQGLLPTIEGGGRLWVISTGNGTHGKGAMYAELWNRATQALNGFVHLFWPWDSRPDRDENWKRRQVDAIGSEERFKVEYPETPDDAFLVATGTPVYSREGIAAAVRLGAELDKDRPEPTEGVVHLGADFGEQAHVLVVWPLERGGFYIAAEHHWAHGESDEQAIPVVALLKDIDQPLGRFRFDASMPRDAKLFARTLKSELGYERPPSPIPFGGTARSPSPGTGAKAGKSNKRMTIIYLRRLFNRAAQGKESGVIAISPNCPRLIEQLFALQFKDDESEDVVKLDDHGPDALIAGVAPTARRYAHLIEEEADVPA